MRIEAGQHAVDGIVDQVRVGDWIDVFTTHPLEYVAEQREQPVGIGSISVVGERRVDGETAHEVARDQAGHRANGHTGEEGGAKQQGGAEPPRTIIHAA